jgi:hypothetical protein
MAIIITNPGIRPYHLPSSPVGEHNSFTPEQKLELANAGITLQAGITLPANGGRLELPEWYVDKLMQERGWRRRLEQTGRNTFVVKSIGGSAATAFEARIRQHRVELQNAQAETRDAKSAADAATQRVAELERRVSGMSDSASDRDVSAKRTADLEAQRDASARRIAELEAQRDASARRIAELELLSKPASDPRDAKPPATEARDTEVQSTPKGGGKR